jgi:hypothetical protein
MRKNHQHRDEVGDKYLNNQISKKKMALVRFGYSPHPI